MLHIQTVDESLFRAWRDTRMRLIVVAASRAEWELLHGGNVGCGKSGGDDGVRVGLMVVGLVLPADSASSSAPASSRLPGGTEHWTQLVQEERHPLRGANGCLDAEIPRVPRWLHTGQTRDPNHDTGLLTSGRSAVTGTRVLAPVRRSGVVLDSALPPSVVPRVARVRSRSLILEWRVTSLTVVPGRVRLCWCSAWRNRRECRLSLSRRRLLAVVVAALLLAGVIVGSGRPGRRRSVASLFMPRRIGVRAIGGNGTLRVEVGVR